MIIRLYSGWTKGNVILNLCDVFCKAIFKISGMSSTVFAEVVLKFPLP